MSKLQIVNEIHKAVRKNFNRRSVLLKGIDDLWQADLIDFQSLKRYNRDHRYILVIIDCFSKFSWAIPVKTKTKKEIANAFQSVLDKNHRKPINLQTDMGTEFYNDEFKKVTTKYNINHYSTYSVKKASIVERLIRTLKNKLFKLFSFNGHYKWIGELLTSVISTYNDTIHRTINYKPKDVNHSNQNAVMKNIIKFQNSNIKHAKSNKLKVGDHVRISRYKSSFEKGYTPNWSTELFLVKNVYLSVPVTYSIEDMYHQPILGRFYEQELLKTNCPNVYLIEKVLRKKGNKLFVKWLGLSKSENSWIDKQAIL